MSLTKIGLDVSGYDTLDSDLELAESDSQVRLRNLGKDYLSAGKSIIMWADYGTDTDATYSTSGVIAPAWEKGSGGSVADGIYDTGGAQYTAYVLPDELNNGIQTMLIRFSPNWTGTPGATQFIMYSMNQNALYANRISLFVATAGKLHAIIYNESDVNICQIGATAAEVNGAGNTWDQSEPVYVAFSIDSTEGAHGVARLYAGRVSDGTANSVGTPDTNIDGIASNNGGNALSVGGCNRDTTTYWADIDVYEWAIFDGPISTAASFTIPAEIEEIFNSGSGVPNPSVVFAEIDLEGSRIVDMSKSNINITGDGAYSVDLYYSCENTSGSPSWVGPFDIAGWKAESDPTGRYFQMKADIASDDGVGIVRILDTGNFLTVGSLTTSGDTQGTQRGFRMIGA